MKQAAKESLLTDIDAGLVLLGSAARPSPKTIDRAVTIFRKVKVACQSIPITPVDETGTPIEPPPTGPEDPPIDPDPENPPGGENPPQPPTTVTVTFNSVADFATTQGYRGWSYLEENGTAMTYSATNGRWQGSLSFQNIWNIGQHPGLTGGAKRRWTAQASGSFAITGTFADLDSGSATGVTVQILKNGSSIYSQTLSDGGSLSPVISGDVTAGDTIDFLVKESGGDIGKDGTGVNITITLTTQGTGGNPTQNTLPFTLNRTAPEDAILTMNMNKPGNTNGCTLSVTGVNLAEAYGLLYFNGTSNTVNLWPTAPGNAGVSATVDLNVPVAYVVNGQNTLRFTHTTGTGYTVTAVTVAFTTPIEPDPPDTQTTLPFILNGAILPEDGLLTINVSKPVNANGCTVTVTGTDLAEADGTLAVNTPANVMTIWPVNPANNGAIRTVVLDVNHAWFVNGTNTLRFTHTSGDGFIISSVSVAFTQQPDPEIPDPGGGTWPNMPTGSTILTNHNFSNLGSDGWNIFAGSTFRKVSDPTAPLSPQDVAEWFYFQGMTAGISPGNYYRSLPNVNRFYMGFWWKPSNPWQNESQSNVNKICFILSNNPNAQPGSGHFVPTMRGPGPNYYVNIALETVMNNSHLGNGFGDVGGTWILNPNAGSTAVTLGQWHRIEILIQNSTTYTSQNGVLRIWVNGVLGFNYTNVNTPDTWKELALNPTWGGLNNTKTQNDYYRMDHVIVARY